MGRVITVGLSLAVLVGCNSSGGTDMGPSDAGGDAGSDAGPPVCATAAECDDGVFCNGAERCAPGTTGASARGCAPGATPCLASQTCSEPMHTCVSDCGTAPDADGDGHRALSCGGDDCDDANPHRYPGAVEICNDVDEDCDPATFGTLDGDHDGYTSSACCNTPAGGSPTCGTDCDDFVPNVHPTATEACDGFDNDCNGMIDEGVTVAVYPDADRDGYGDLGSAVVMKCAGAAGYASTAGDCAPMDIAVHPGQAEICDAKDNDCNGMIDDGTTAVVWYADLDGDGFGSAASGTQSSCEPLTGFSLLGTDCNDHLRGVSPAADEACNGRDDDCNGRADFSLGPNDFEDDDGDGHPDARCAPAGDDCNDRDVNVYPGAVEICDGVDDDCNGVADDMTMSASWYPDADGDGYGDASATATSACVQPAGRVQRTGDCDDSDATRHPGARDVCNGHDDDCDAMIDEDAAQNVYWAVGSDADGDGVAASSAVPTLSCMAPPAGAVRAGGDCDDTSAAVGPQRREVCNGVDDDCSGTVDDGLGTLTCSMGSGATMCSRTVPACTAGIAASCTVLPPVQDVCNGVDDDCDGTVDEAPDASRSCARPHTVTGCAAGACTVSACTGTYANCNSAASDGCEADLQASATSCGTCGHACPPGDTCVLGRCSSTIAQLVAGDHFTCALYGAGTVYCWGDNTRGQVGANTTVTPVRTAMQALFSDGTGAHPPITDAVELAAGSEFVCARRSGGTLLCWGRGTEYQIDGGVGGGADHLDGQPSGWTGPAPVQVFATGTLHGLVTAVGDVYFLGSQVSGEFGTGGASGTAYAYVRYATSGHTLVAHEVRCGHGTCAGLDQGTGTWWVWGDNTDYKMCPTCGSPVLTVYTGAPNFTDVRFVGFGTQHSCHVASLTSDIYCSGQNDRGQLGRGIVEVSARSDSVATGTSGSRGLAVGASHTCVINDYGAVNCWGGNEHGQVGNGTVADTGTVNNVSVPGLDTTANPATLIAAGAQHSCAALTDGNVYCWGTNLLGELGDGTATDRHAPVIPVSGLP